MIIVVALAAVPLITAIASVARTKPNQHRHIAADKIRDDARQETLQVRQQDVHADETAAQARAAQAEADVKAAQAAGLHSKPPSTATRPPPPEITSTSHGTAPTHRIRQREQATRRRLAAARKIQEHTRSPLEPEVQ